MAKIKSHLCTIGGFVPDESEFPPKPKWMRWDTYNRAFEKFDRYEDCLDARLMRFMRRAWLQKWICVVFQWGHSS